MTPEEVAELSRKIAFQNVIDTYNDWLKRNTTHPNYKAVQREMWHIEFKLDNLIKFGEIEEPE